MANTLNRNEIQRRWRKGQQFLKSALAKLGYKPVGLFLPTEMIEAVKLYQQNSYDSHETGTLSSDVLINTGIFRIIRDHLNAKQEAGEFESTDYQVLNKCIESDQFKVCVYGQARWEMVNDLSAWKRKQNQK